MFGELLIHINGTKSMTIENFKNMLDYKDNFVHVQGKEQNLKVYGEDLVIDYFTQDSMRLLGSFEKLEFQNKIKKG